MIKRLDIIVPSLVAITMLLIAAFIRLPYDYYIILRWIICITGFYFAYNFYQKKKMIWVWALIITALIFNPLFRIGLKRDTWVILNLIAAGVFIISLVQLSRKKG